jgi:hypothetical protein
MHSTYAQKVYVDLLRVDIAADLNIATSGYRDMCARGPNIINSSQYHSGHL